MGGWLRRRHEQACGGGGVDAVGLRGGVRLGCSAGLRGGPREATRCIVSDASSAPRTTSGGSAQPASGFRAKNLIIIGLVTAVVWAVAIASESLIALIVVGVLTVLLAALLFWAWRMFSKQKSLANLLQGATASPEARREALAALDAQKDSKELTHVFARAQLVAADDPAAALAMLEPIDLKKVPPAMQDDFALLRAQLLLNFGRAKAARPLVDRINVDNPQRKEARGMMVAVVAETWARTGQPKEALELLDSEDASSQENDQVRAQLLMARAFARFATGKKGAAREALRTLSSIDVNLLGRFLMPQFRVHPGLQRLAREIAQKHPDARRQSAAAAPRRGRPR